MWSVFIYGLLEWAPRTPPRLELGSWAFTGIQWYLKTIQKYCNQYIHFLGNKYHAWILHGTCPHLAISHTLCLCTCVLSVMQCVFMRRANCYVQDPKYIMVPPLQKSVLGSHINSGWMNSPPTTAPSMQSLKRDSGYENSVISNCDFQGSPRYRKQAFPEKESLEDSMG